MVGDGSSLRVPTDVISCQQTLKGTASRRLGERSESRGEQRRKERRPGNLGENLWPWQKWRAQAGLCTLMSSDSGDPWLPLYSASHARLLCKESCKMEGHVSVCEHHVCLLWISSEMQINEILYFCGRRGVWLCSNHECTMVWSSRTILPQPNRGKSQGMSVPPQTENTNTVVFFVQGKIRNFPGTLCQEERGQSERKEHRRRNI